MKRSAFLGLLIVWSVFVFGTKGLFGSEVEKAKEEVETTEKSKLEKKNGIYYKKNAKKPFTGKLVVNYKNGKKYIEANFKNGLLNGKELSLYENGKKASEWNHKDGKQHGRCIYLDENGKITSEKNFKNGVEIK